MKKSLSETLKDMFFPSWVIDEVIAIENDLGDAYIEIGKLRSRVVFDRKVHEKSKEFCKNFYADR